MRVLHPKVAVGFVAQADPAPGWLEQTLGARVVQEVTVLDLLVVAALVAATWVVSHLVQRALARAVARRKGWDEGSQQVARRLVHYVVMCAGVFVALNVIGIELASLFAAGAVMAVVVGFALQNLSENFVSGLILMVERTITPGDVLEVEGRVVRVLKMGIRATVARTRDDEDLIVPNSILVRSTVKNFTLRDRSYRLRSLVGVAYSSDMARVQQVLADAAAAIPWRSADRTPRVLLTEFGASSVNFEVSVWIDDPWRSRTRLSDLNHAVWNALRAADVTIAFPQLDVHADAALLEALRSRSS
jgi:small-conductance mechanosensitive channel